VRCSVAPRAPLTLLLLLCIDCFPVSFSVPLRLRPIPRALLFRYCGACAAGSRDQVRARERGWVLVRRSCAVRGGMLGAFRRNTRVVLISAGAAGGKRFAQALRPLPTVFSQSSFQSRRAASRMRRRACVRVTWFLCAGLCVPCFASSSAQALPLMFACAGTHAMAIVLFAPFGRVSDSFSGLLPCLGCGI